jgi:hypothetical protein
VEVGPDVVVVQPPPALEVPRAEAEPAEPQVAPGIAAPAGCTCWREGAKGWADYFGRHLVAFLKTLFCLWVLFVPIPLGVALVIYLGYWDLQLAFVCFVPTLLIVYKHLNGQWDPIHRALKTRCFVCSLDRAAKVWRVDRDMLAFAFNLTLLTTRDQTRLRELKMRLDGWIHKERPHWGQVAQTAQILRCLYAVGDLLEVEIDVVNHIGRQIPSLRHVHAFATSGATSGGFLPQR